MKKLSLLMFAILILGCGTETTVIEEAEFVAEEPPRPVIKYKPPGHPLIARGTVKHGQINVDPESLSTGFFFILKKPFARYSAGIREKDGGYLPWEFPHDGILVDTDVVFIEPLYPGSRLEYDTEYVIEIYAQTIDCDVSKIVIPFRTKPQKMLVREIPIVMQEHIPAVASGERFRLDISPPDLLAGDVFNGKNNVAPEPLNVNGIHLELTEDIKRYEIDLRLKDGASLGWLPLGLVGPGNFGRHIQIMPAEGAPLLDFDTTYQIDIFLQDLQCSSSEFTILFHTKPKP